jgi:glutathionylspermidine synthase
MIRRPVAPIRNDWQRKVEEIGFHFYEIDGLPYWDESAFYEFTSAQIDHLDDVTTELNGMCLQLVERVVREELFGLLGIPPLFWDFVRSSWNVKQPTIYGRFDLCYDGRSEPKLLEFNADTPTALFEASVVQYYWLQEFDAERDQFNSIHEKLLDRFSTEISTAVGKEVLHFSCVKESVEDYTTTEYLRDVAIQAGLETKHLFIDEIGYNHDPGIFVDLEEREIRHLFKLYPWEWMVQEEFGPFLTANGIILCEPPWKMILSNKAILPLLWQMFPDHPNLLPSFFGPPQGGEVFVEKPFFSREGEGVVVASGFAEGKKQCIYQQYRELPQFSGNYPVIGSWVIGSEPAGIGIREDTTPITNNLSRFIPHCFINA